MNSRDNKYILGSLLGGFAITLGAGFVGNKLIPKRGRKYDELGGFNIPYVEPAEEERVETFRELEDMVNTEARNDNYSEFRYQDEIPNILKHAKRVGVEPEMLMALRNTENGADNIAYGIIPQGHARERYENDKGYNLDGEFHEYSSEREKQLSWAAWTIKRNLERFENDSEGYEDFISFLASKYAPIGVDNDPNDLNKNWEGNFRFFYNEFKEK